MTTSNSKNCPISSLFLSLSLCTKHKTYSNNGLKRLIFIFSVMLSLKIEPQKSGRCPYVCLEHQVQKGNGLKSDKA